MPSLQHAATMTSPRLQRVAKLLSDGRPHSGLEIIRKGRVIAVSSIISELRCNGAEIGCVKTPAKGHAGWVWHYTMTKGPET